MKAVYKENSEKAQDRINKIIFQNNLNESEIARALGMLPQTLNYQLHEAVNLDREVEAGIYIYFRSKGIFQYQEDECRLVNDNFLDLTSIITQQISILSNTIRKAIASDDIDDKERDDLLHRTRNLKIEVTKKIDDLENTLKGISQVEK